MCTSTLPACSRTCCENDSGSSLSCLFDFYVATFGETILKIAQILVCLYIFYRLVHLYFVPTNCVKDLYAFGPVRSDQNKLSGTGQGKRVAAVGHQLATDHVSDSADLSENENWRACRTARARAEASRAGQVNEVRQRQRRALMPPPYPNGWFTVLESCDLKPTQVKPLNVLGMELVIFRSVSGAVYIVDSICPHLGASLTQGVVRHEAIECPFHRWQFDGCSGSVCSVPYSAQKPESLARFRVSSWPVMEANELVYMWHHAEGLPPYWRPQHLLDTTHRALQFYGRTEHIVAAHIQDIPENGADPAHLNAIHQQIFASGNDLHHSSGWRWLTHCWNATWQASGEVPHQAEVHMEAAFRLFDRFTFCGNTVFVRQVGPGLVHMQFSGPLGTGVLLQSVTPIGPLRQRVLHKIYWQRFYGLGPLIAKFYLFVETIQFERDVRVWNNKNHLIRPCLLKEDFLIAKFRRWYSQFYSEHSSHPYQIQDRLEF